MYTGNIRSSESFRNAFERFGKQCPDSHGRVATGSVTARGVMRDGMQSRNKAGASTATVQARDSNLLEALADGQHGTREGIHYVLPSHI